MQPPLHATFRARKRAVAGDATTPSSKKKKAFTATAAEEPNNAEKASARTTRRSALLSGESKEAKTPKQLCAAVAAAAKPTPARGLGAMGTTTPVAPSVAATPASTSSRGGAAASGGILTPRKRPLLQSSTVITLSAAAAAVPGAPRAPATSATSAAAAAPAPSSAAAAAAPLLPSTTATTATARAAALVSGLPEPHASLAAAFAALHSAAALVRGRGGQRLTFEGTGGCGNGVGGGNRGGNNPNSARAAVERATGRRFSVSHVLQIRALYPEGVALEYVNAPGSVAAAPGAGGGGGGAGASLPPMLLAIRVTDPAAGSAREEFARRLRGACEAAARRAAREAEGRCRSPAASGCRKSSGGTRARRGEEDEEREEDEEEEAVRARAAAAAAVTAAPGLLLRLPEAPLPPLPPGRVAATPHFGPSASAAEEKEEDGEEGKQEPAAAASAAPPTSFPRPPLAPSSSSALASRARQRLTFGDAGGAAAVGARAAALSDAEVLRASLPAALAREAIEGLGATAEGGGSAARGLADLPMSAVRAAHAAQARRDAVADPERAEARARSALLALLPRAFDCARAAFGGSGSGGSSASGLGSLRIPGGRPPTPAPCVKPLSLVHDALSRAVLGSASGGGGAPAGGGSSSTAAAPSLALALDAPALARELAAAAPEVFSIGEPRLGREAEGPVLRINRAADAGAARARLVAAAAADRASNAA